MKRFFAPLLSCLALIAWSGSSHAEDAFRLATRGGKLKADQVATLEEKVAKDPTDVSARTELLGFYFTNARRDPAAKVAKRKHVLWLIENEPQAQVLSLPYGQLQKFSDTEGYAEVKVAWQKQAEKTPPDLGTLASAAKFFLLSDRPLAEKLLLKGQAIDPEDPSWSESLGRLYSLGLVSIRDEDERRKMAGKALAQYLNAYENSPPINRDAMLTSLAKAAFAADQMDEAKRFAEEMLAAKESGWNYGNRVHHGNLILGRIALKNKDVAKAKFHLLAAGKTPGSPQLDSFGPNMLLAKEFIEAGETDAVVVYFQLCKKFWKGKEERLDRWTDDVKAGRMPEFRGNLAY